MDVWMYGCMEVWRYGVMEEYGDTTMYGGMEVWRYGGMKLQVLRFFFNLSTQSGHSSLPTPVHTLSYL